jgi:hypothetical protein
VTYLDEVVRLRMPMVRARFMPKEFLALRKVHVTAGSVGFDVEIEVTDGPGCFGGARRWFRCPGCAARTTVIGISAYTGGVGCRKCWRWRKRAAAEIAPHTRSLVATITPAGSPASESSA